MAFGGLRLERNTPYGEFRAGICRHDIVLIFRGRALAMLAAHLIAQIGRRVIDRLHVSTVPSDGISQFRPPLAVEAPLQKLRSLERPHGGGGGAKNNGNQALAVTRGGGHEIEPGGADEPGLHAVGAGIAAKQRVVVALHHLSHADARQVPVVVIFRELADERARENGKVARGGNLIVRRQAVGIDEA